MNLEKGYLYHIYNQGNNRRRIFFKRDNYLFFLKKIKLYISPYADVIAWCLMPNHFHLMVLVREEKIVIDNNIHTVTSSHGVNNSSHGVNNSNIKTRTINDSIGIMLRSYTRAINKQEDFTGKLFREKTKAECLNCLDGITPSFFINNGVTSINIQDSEKQYPQICFNYIHQNPLTAKMVKEETDYEYSSARDYAGIRKGKLINKKIAFEYIDYKKR